MAEQNQAQSDARHDRNGNAALLRSERAGAIFIGEQEPAKSMAAYIAQECLVEKIVHLRS